MSGLTKTALVLGANGALGIDVVRSFAAKNWRVIGVDIAKPRAECAGLLHGSAVFNPEWSIETMQSELLANVSGNFDAVVNVAGGWAGGSVADASTAAATELMLRQSVWTSIVAAHFAATRGTTNSFLALTGSAAALNGTAGMVGYGLAKAAVHHLVRSMGADPSKLPAGSCVVGILPMTLDTPSNRACMPTADFAQWTPTKTMADDITSWAAGSIDRPKSGALCVWKTKDGATKIDIC